MQVRDAASQPTQRLHVGIADGMPKLVVRRLMQPVLAVQPAPQEPRLRLRCDEGEFDDLLAELALHRLDVVLADRAAPPRGTTKLYSHALETSPLAWYAAPSLHARAKCHFPQSLASVPVLLPTPHAAVRARLDGWFERLGIAPQLVGEFGDSALMKTFGASGMGAFPAPGLVHDELLARYRVKCIGPCEGMAEHFFAIGTERKVQHPLVQRLLHAR